MKNTVKTILVILGLLIATPLIAEVKQEEVRPLSIIQEDGYTHVIVDTDHLPFDTYIYCVAYNKEGVPVDTDYAYSLPIVTTVTFLTKQNKVRCVAIYDYY